MRTARVSLSSIVAALLLPALGMCALTITNPSVHQVQFNTAKGESVQLAYSLSAPAKVRVRAYSPDDLLVRTVISWDSRSAGKHTETWDGKDDRGKVVPDEAYYFTIEASDGKGSVTTYDPTRISGGEELEITDPKYDTKTREIVFDLKKPSRVMVRAGIASGPLVSTPVDWRPFDTGTQRIAWDGKDENDNMDAGAREDLKLYGIGYLLPSCSVLSTGNESLTYRDYLTSLPKTVFRKSQVTPSVRRVAISPHWGRPPRFSRAIGFSMDKIRVENGKLVGTITIPADEVTLLRGVAYEVIAYIDNDLLLDDERGHTPYALSLDLESIPPGEHLVTVNVASVTDRIGTQTALFVLPPSK